TLTIDGQGGIDTLTFDNSSDTVGRTYTLTNTTSYGTLHTLTIIDTAPIAFLDRESAPLRSSHRTNLNNVRRTLYGSSTFVNAAAATARIYTLSLHDALPIWTLTIDGQGGADTLTFDNSGDTVGRTYTLTNSTSYATLQAPGLMDTASYVG